MVTTGKAPHCKMRGLFIAESGGFEPPVQYNPYDSLANCWFQPLTQLSNPCWYLEKIQTSDQDVANIRQ